MDIKGQFPDETTLRNHLRANMDAYVQQVKDFLGPLEAQYRENKKLRRSGAALLAVAVVELLAILPIYSLFESTLSRPILSVLYFSASFLSAGTLGVWGWKKLKGALIVIKAFHSAVNTFLYPLAFDIFGLQAERLTETQKDADALHATLKKANDSFWASSIRTLKVAQELSTSPEQDRVMTLLEDSELITEPRNLVVIDDLVTTSFDERALFFSELSVKHTTNTGKNSHTKDIFQGYFVSFDLKRPLAGKTFVSTEGDTAGFGHQSFFSTKQIERLAVTQLEWNDFEELLHVLTNDPTEARYILTPNFMLDLHDWWLDKKRTIRISFIDQKMYLLFPDTNIRIGETVKDVNTQQLQTYLESITIPLLHVLHLIEDIKQ